MGAVIHGNFSLPTRLASLGSRVSTLKIAVGLVEDSVDPAQIAASVVSGLAVDVVNMVEAVRGWVVAESHSDNAVNKIIASTSLLGVVSDHKVELRSVLS